MSWTTQDSPVTLKVILTSAKRRVLLLVQVVAASYCTSSDMGPYGELKWVVHGSA
jgi:hypothetical protein